MPQATLERSYVSGRNVGPFNLKKEDVGGYKALRRLGLDMAESEVKKLYAYATGQDTAASPITTASIGTPVQFLQTWLPGYVKIMTAARKIDEILGIQMVGNWFDEEIIQPIVESLGVATPYGDLNNVPLASYNPTYDRRTIVRFEMGFRVGVMEEARAAAGRLSSGELKRESAGLALEVQRNLVGFNGYNSGAGRTYGFLNDPNEPAYVTVPNGASASPLWANKTYLEIIADIRTAMAKIQTQSQDNANPEDVMMTLVLPTNAYQFLSVTTTFGNGGGSVRNWLAVTYPKLRIISAPQLNTANGGVGVFYLFVDSTSDASTDGGQTFVQAVQAKTNLLGVQKLIKGYEEDYNNATAGVICKRPFLMVRYSGVS